WDSGEAVPRENPRSLLPRCIPGSRARTKPAIPYISLLKFVTKLGFLNIQAQLLWQLTEAFSMVWAQAVLLNGRPVLAGGVSLVSVPMVHRKLFMEFQHKFVPMGFCKDGRRGNAHIFSISLHETFVLNIGIGIKTVSVHQNKAWGPAQGA